MSNCKVKYQGGQNVCDRCGFTYDLDDDDPPKCLTDAQIKAKPSSNRLKNTTKRLKKATHNLSRSTSRKRSQVTS